MKKLTAIILTLITALLLLASCQIGGGDTPPANGGGENQGGNQGNNPGGNTDAELLPVWAPEVTTKIVTSDDTDINAQLLYDEIAKLSTSSPHLIPETDPEGAHEVMVGRVNRSLSNLAYRKLERLMEGTDGEAGFVIMSQGGSLAIAYDSPYSLDASISYLFANYPEKTLSLPDGVVHSERFNIITYVADRRNEKREAEFVALREALGEETASAIENLYTLYDEKLYIWIANLYDPDRGGFYFSNSGRDNQGFLPDIESTVQAINHLQSGGMFREYAKSYVEAFPEEIKNQLLAFAKGLQDPEDGYFYHPQWGKDIIAARRGRDLGWATSLITTLGSKPFYDAPDGTKGEKRVGEASAVAYLTGRLSSSVTAAVTSLRSSVVATSKSSLPDYLQSLSAWADYIEMLNIPGDSYVAGNTLAAQHGQIALAGQEYVDYLISYLDEHQHPHNGLWEMETNYNTVNGLMKLASVYNYYKRTMPYAKEALESAMYVALLPEGDTHVCSVYNPWVAMNIVLTSIKSSEGSAAQANLRKTVLENATALVETTYNKISGYYVDGGFHYHRSMIGHSSQGALVSCNTEYEADVNASAISSTGILSNMFSVFGVSSVRLYHSDDCRYFLDLLTNLGTIVKAEAPPVQTVTFDNYSSSEGEEEYGVAYYPDTKVSTVIYEDDKKLDERGNLKFFATAVVPDPYPEKKGDLALKVNTFVLTDENGEREVPDKAMSTSIDIENHYIVGSTFIYEADMLVMSGNGVFQQIFFSTKGSSQSFSLNLQIYNKGDKQYIKIYDNYAGPDGEKDTNIVDGIPAGEWFNLRIELYKLYAETSDGAGTRRLTTKAKIFINGEYVGESEASNTTSTGAVVDRAIDSITLSHYRFSQTEVYLDNIHAEKTNGKYVYQQVPIDPSSIPSYVPAPAGEPVGGAYYLSAESFGKKYGFENMKKPPALSNGISAKTYITDEGRVFFWRLGDEDGIHEGITHAGVSMPEDMENPVLVTELDVAFGNIDPSRRYAVMVRLHGNGMRASVYFSTDADGNLKLENGVELSCFKPLEQNKWYNLTFEMYNVSDTVSRIKVYINGEFAAEVAGLDYLENTSSNAFLQLQYTDSDSWMLYDNLFVGYDSIEYVEAKEKAPEGLPTISDPNGVKGSGVYYGGDAAGIRFDYDNGEIKPSLNQGMGPVNTYITDERYVYYYRTESGATSYLPIECGKLSLPEATNTVTAIVEGDFAFGRVDAAYFGVIGFYGNGRRVNVFLSANAEGRIVFPHMKSGGFEGLEQDTWYNLRFELYYLGPVSEGNASMAVRLFVNGEYACDISAVDVSAYTSNRLLLQLQNSDTELWMAYDNIYIGYFDMEYTAPPADEPDPDEPVDPDPDEPIPDEPSYGEGDEGALPGHAGSNYDNVGGWTEP